MKVSAEAAKRIIFQYVYSRLCDFTGKYCSTLSIHILIVLATQWMALLLSFNNVRQFPIKNAFLIPWHSAKTRRCFFGKWIGNEHISRTSSKERVKQKHQMFKKMLCFVLFSRCLSSTRLDKLCFTLFTGTKRRIFGLFRCKNKQR